MKLSTLVARFGGKCHYCMIELSMVRYRHDSATRDEIIPQSLGGRRIVSNTVAACWTCNNARGAMPYREFFNLVRTHGRPKDRCESRPGGKFRGKHLRDVQRKHDDALEAIIRDSDAPWNRKPLKAPKEPMAPAGIATLGDVFMQAKKR